MCVFVRERQRERKSEQTPISVDEEVIKLDVAVHDTAAVAVLQKLSESKYEKLSESEYEKLSESERCTIPEPW